jgi:hypothetical protein
MTIDIRRSGWQRGQTVHLPVAALLLLLLLLVMIVLASRAMGIDNEESSAWLNLGQWQHQGRLVMTNLCLG